MTNNVSSMPTDWWAWDGDKLLPLGICDDIDEADEKCSSKHFLAHWLFSRESLIEFRANIDKELK